MHFKGIILGVGGGTLRYVSENIRTIEAKLDLSGPY